MTRSSSAPPLPPSSTALQTLSREEAIQEIRRLETELATLQQNEKSSVANSYLAEVSHELRTPLTGIVKLANLLSDRAIGSQEKKYAQLIKKSGIQLEKTLDAVLTLAKMDADHTSLDSCLLNVPDEVELVFRTFEPEAESKGLDYTLTVEDEDAPLNAVLHPGALSSIVQNLLSNAIKYTEEGSVDVTVRAASSSGTPMVELEVADTGAGISDSFAEKLFDRFARDGVGSDTFSEGTGLGLTLVKCFIDRMGGTLDVETEKGEGSRFSVRLPRLREQAPSLQQARDGSAESPQSGKEILFVEGNANTQRAIRVLIEDRWGLTPASTSEECLQLVSNRGDTALRPFDLILLGIERGDEGSDANFLPRLKEQTREHNIPVVALTHGDWSTRGNLALDGYISEPFTSSKLVTEIARYLTG